MLADRFHSHWRETNKNIAAVSVMADAAILSPEEFGPLMELIAEADSFADNPGGPLMRLLTLRWAMLDPKAALAFTMGRPELKSDNELLFSVVCEVAKVDLPAAKAAVLTLSQEGWADAGPAVLRILQERDVRAALTYARELKNAAAEADVLEFMVGRDPMAAAAELVPGRQEHLKVVETIAAALLKHDRAAFDAWAGSLNDPAQRSVALCAALTRDADTDPRGAAQGMAAWVARDAEASAYAGDLAAKLAVRLADSGGKPAEVAAWALSLPEGNAQNAAVGKAGQQLLDQDTMAASDWLRSVPPGQGKDSTVLRLVEKISGDTPADAFEWARTVEIQALRLDALRQALWSWTLRDPDAAAQALETLPAKDRVFMRDVFETAKEER